MVFINHQLYLGRFFFIRGPEHNEGNYDTTYIYVGGGIPSLGIVALDISDPPPPVKTMIQCKNTPPLNLFTPHFKSNMVLEDRLTG